MADTGQTSGISFLDWWWYYLSFRSGLVGWLVALYLSFSSFCLPFFLYPSLLCSGGLPTCTRILSMRSRRGGKREGWGSSSVTDFSKADCSFAHPLLRIVCLCFFKYGVGAY